MLVRPPLLELLVQPQPELLVPPARRGLRVQPPPPPELPSSWGPVDAASPSGGAGVVRLAATRCRSGRSAPRDSRRHQQHSRRGVQTKRNAGMAFHGLLAVHAAVVMHRKRQPHQQQQQHQQPQYQLEQQQQRQQHQSQHVSCILQCSLKFAVSKPHADPRDRFIHSQEMHQTTSAARTTTRTKASMLGSHGKHMWLHIGAAAH